MNELNNELITEMSKPEAEGLWYWILIVVGLCVFFGWRDNVAKAKAKAEAEADEKAKK